MDAAQSKSLTTAAHKNKVSSSAISQAIKWLEDWYQVKLMIHGKNKFVLTEKGYSLFTASEKLFFSVDSFDSEVKIILNPLSQTIKFSMQQSIANSIVSKSIKNFKEKFPDIELKVRIGTSHYCKQLMESENVNYSISIDNVNFDGHSKKLYDGKFVFISSRDDNRPPEKAGFILTEDTKEVLELKKQYFKKNKVEIPVNFSVSSWGVITNLALAGNGIAYIPDYYLAEIHPSRYRIRKINIIPASFSVNFYYSKNVEFTVWHQHLFDEVKKSFKLIQKSH
jgi:DNA-binding transcriptional LysR family regulator